MTAVRIAVLGGGIIGLACAWDLLRDGHDVRVYDPDPAGGATRAAAGMLAPAGEAWHGEEDLLRLGLESAAMWPRYARDLEAASRTRVDLRLTGTLLVGQDADDLAVVRRTRGLLEGQGITATDLDRRALSQQDPGLSRRAAGGVLLRDDHHVNPRRVARALLAVLVGRVHRLRTEPVVAAGCATGVRTDRGEEPADVVIVATGSTLPAVTGVAGLVRPVRGEVVRVRLPEEQAPVRTIRAEVHGVPVYVVPRAGGEVVVGATSEEQPPAPAGEERPTVGGVGRLLDAAREVYPGLDRAEILEVLARSRPATPDNGPLLGPTGVDGLLVAAGHHRGGVLLAPVTARAVTAHVAGTAPPEVTRPFLPSRFEEELPCRSR